MQIEPDNLLYENPLRQESDLQDFRLEGDACITFPRDRMRMEQAYERDRDKGRHANFVFWCPETFPSDIMVRWEFLPHSDAGLAMIWFAAHGSEGRDLFDPELSPRAGDYPEYHHGDLNAYHLAYYRRNKSEIGLQTCNLRKSYGFHLLQKGGDPLPTSAYATEPYSLQLIKHQGLIRFSINDIPVLAYQDDGAIGGEPLGGGRIGFRQMAGLIADYSNLQVFDLKDRSESASS
ncbi:MAG: DUF1961 family protein [Planctomycetota bacterium]